MMTVDLQALPDNLDSLSDADMLAISYQLNAIEPSEQAIHATTSGDVMSLAIFATVLALSAVTAFIFKDDVAAFAQKSRDTLACLPRRYFSWK
ncbi:MAG: hypothetical protein AAF569_07460 [Pseudomonadota bacterium]